MKKSILILTILFFSNITLFALNSSDSNGDLSKKDQLIYDLYKFYLKERFELNFSDNVYLSQDIFDDNEFESKFPKIESLVNAIKYVAENITFDDVSKSKCIKILDFNTNYLKLKDIKKNVLTKKYDSLSIRKTLKEISQLPELDSNISPLLYNRRILTIALLNNYSLRTRELKTLLDKLSRADQNSNFTKSDYKSLEKSKLYENYPFLLNVIRTIQKNVLLYVPDELSVN